MVDSKGGYVVVETVVVPFIPEPFGRGIIMDQELQTDRQRDRQTDRQRDILLVVHASTDL